MSRFEFASAEAIGKIMERAAEAHFNVVYFQVRGAADALYRSKIEPCAPSLCGHLGGVAPYDPLAVAVHEAHRHGLQLHAWINVLTAMPAGTASVCDLLANADTSGPKPLLLRHPEWIMVDAKHQPLPCPNGEQYLWVSPGYGGVRAEAAHVAADIVRRYDVDGVHLDRIRYPGRSWSYDSASLSSFGRDPEVDPEAWDAFRRRMVNLTVRSIRDSIRAARPGITLSAATWGVYDERLGWQTIVGRRDLFQDPRAWVDAGTIDVVVPMTYFPISDEPCARGDWACAITDHLPIVRGKRRRHVYLGIDGRLGAREVLREIRLGRRKGANGFSIFSYGALNEGGLFEALRDSAFSTKARVPRMAWKTH